MGFPGGAEVKNLLANAGAAGDMSSVAGLGISLEEEMANPLQGSCQKTPMDRGVWRITVHRVTKSGTRLSN